MSTRRLLIHLVFFTIGAPNAVAQCGPLIGSFPYVENFEAGPAWTAGGNASDWEWGTPNKPVIDAPGEGNASWVVGGLIGSSYSDGQQSWLESPCFDLTTLEYPWVSFKLFWETERNYDGVGFQYSLDEGSTWTNLGSFTSPAHCLNSNWFNSQNIVGLNLAQPRQGWSGRIGATVGNCGGGEGSGDWVTASHCLTDVAGEPSVKFRFIFGAGTICNGFDGVAVDEFRIAEAPPNEASFNFACNGTTVEFQDASALCPSSWTWDFGDPASGAANTATGAAVSHTFSSGGSYTVTLSVQGPCNAPSTFSRTLYVADPDFTVVQPGCAGNDGSITVDLVDPPASLTYLWTPGGPAGPTLNELAPGTYSLTVQGPDVCGFQESFTLEQDGEPILVQADVQPVSCNGDADGAIALTVSGGSAPYTFAWTPAVGVGPAAEGLAAGSYEVLVTDAEGCTLSVTEDVPEPEALDVQPAPDLTLCPGQSTTLSAVVGGGTAPYTTVWSPAGPEVSPLASTTYTAIVTDANGCIADPVSTTLEVAPLPAPAIVLDAAVGCVPHCITADAAGVPADASVQWTFGDGAVPSTAMSTTHCYTLAGTYVLLLTVTTAEGCTATAQNDVEAAPVPEALFFPSPAVTTIEEPVFSFRDASTNATLWSWDLGDGTTATERNVTHAYTAVGCYPVTLEVSNDQGCTDAAALEVCVEDAFRLWAPNAFTPNNDGFNDAFGVVTTVGGSERFELAVYDRWGRRVFVGNTLGDVWDGSSAGIDLPDGIYAWTVELQDRSGLLRKARGHVTLLR